MEPKTILPADTYTVVNRTILTDYERKTIINLYLPIMGVEAVSLYFVLWQDLEKPFKDQKYNHHHLMTTLKIGLSPVTKARKNLESMGLLRTYYKSGEINDYYYEIYSPLTPYEFFNHPIFSVILLNNIGSTEYEELLKYYESGDAIPKSYEEITTNIDFNFKSVNSATTFSAENVEDTKSLGANLSSEVIDFSLLLSSLPKDLVSEKTFNKRTRELINSLAFVYGFDTLKMCELLRLVINENGIIDKEALRINAMKYYRFNNSGSLPTLVSKDDKDKDKGLASDMSNRGKMLYIFENTTPYDFLRSKYHGADPTPRDLKLIEYLAVDLGLDKSVINVLIDYCLKSNDNKLTKAYVETIAGQWKRLDIKTAEEAMRTAEKEHKKNKKLTTTSRSKPVTEVKTPQWFDEKNDIKEVSDEEKDELENMLKEFK